MCVPAVKIEINVLMASFEHWKPCMRDAYKHIAVHRAVNNVQELLYSLLEEVGFEHITCKSSDARNGVTGVNPYIGKLPAHRKEKYLQELRHEQKIQACTEGYAKAGTDRVYLPYKLIMIHARKP